MNKDKNDTKTLPVHRDVVAALAEWGYAFRFSGEGHAAEERALASTLVEYGLPKPPEPPLYEQVLAELGSRWTFSKSSRVTVIGFFRFADLSFPLFCGKGRTAVQIADALRVLAGEEV